MEIVKKIDIHVHSDVWHEKYCPESFKDKIKHHILPNDLRKKYDSMGIEKGVLLASIDEDNDVMEYANEYSAEVSKEYPDLFIWFCNLDPRIIETNPQKNICALLNKYKQMGAKGVGELCPPIPADCATMDYFYSCCEECDLPIIIHMQPLGLDGYGLRDTLGLPKLENVLKKHPKLKVFGHSGLFWSHISGNVTEDNMNGYPKGEVTTGGSLVRLMREYENLYGDLSAGSGENSLLRDADFAYRFIEEMQDKLLFGTDIGSVGTQRRLSFWLDESYLNGCISENAYRKICRENAERLLKL